MNCRGEIDCLGGVSITEERKDSMLFPDTAMGTDQYYLYKRTNDVSISPTDISTFAGKKVGGIRDNQITAFTLEWMQEKDVDLEIVYFDSFEEQEAGFEQGEIDLLAQTINNVLSLNGIAIAAKIGEDPFVLQNLQYVNYGATLINKTLTDEEREWVANHSKITVAYLDNYLPYSDTAKDGQAIGIILLLVVSLHRKAVQVSEKEAHIRQVQTLNEELNELRCKADAESQWI